MSRSEAHRSTTPSPLITYGNVAATMMATELSRRINDEYHGHSLQLIKNRFIDTFGIDPTKANRSRIKNIITEMYYAGVLVMTNSGAATIDYTKRFWFHEKFSTPRNTRNLSDNPPGPPNIDHAPIAHNDNRTTITDKCVIDYRQLVNLISSKLITSGIEGMDRNTIVTLLAEVSKYKVAEMDSGPSVDLIINVK